MKRLEREDLIRTIHGQKDFQVFLLGIIFLLIVVLAIIRGDLVRAEDIYEEQIKTLKEEIVTLTDDKVMTEEELKFFKEENLELYKQLTNSYQLEFEKCLINPCNMNLIFIDGYAFYYDSFNSNALYYMSDNGILIPQYNEDGTIKTID